MYDTHWLVLYSLYICWVFPTELRIFLLLYFFQLNLTSCMYDTHWFVLFSLYICWVISNRTENISVALLLPTQLDLQNSPPVPFHQFFILNIFFCPIVNMNWINSNQLMPLPNFHYFALAKFLSSANEVSTGPTCQFGCVYGVLCISGRGL